MSKRSIERERFLADVIIGAVEGGTGYWAQVSAYKHSDGAANTFAILHRELDDQSGYDSEGMRLDITAVAQGISRIEKDDIHLSRDIAANILQASRENYAGYLDSEDADIITQVALLGDVIYG